MWQAKLWPCLFLWECFYKRAVQSCLLHSLFLIYFLKDISSLSESIMGKILDFFSWIPWDQNLQLTCTPQRRDEYPYILASLSYGYFFMLRMGEVSNEVIQTIEKTQGNTHLLPHHNTQFHAIGSLRASSPSDPGEYARASGEAAWGRATFASPLACLSHVFFSRLENLLASYGVDSFFHCR